MEPDISQYVVISYTNHEGVEGERIVRPISTHFSSSPYHEGEGEQWLLEAYAVDRGDQRSFALKEITSWRPANDDDRPAIRAAQDAVVEQKAAVHAVPDPATFEEGANTVPAEDLTQEAEAN